MMARVRPTWDGREGQGAFIVRPARSSTPGASPPVSPPTATGWVSCHKPGYLTAHAVVLDSDTAANRVPIRTSRTAKSP